MNPSQSIFTAPAFTIGATSISGGQAMIGAAALAILLLGVLAIALWRTANSRAAAAEEIAARSQETETRLADILKAQAEMQGRMASLTDVFSSRQSELNKALSERLDGMTTRIGQSMQEQSKATHENLARLQERLAVIDTAQSNIQSLAGQVVQLQAILSDKQTRGAFGQSRMEAIVADGLPQGAYSFQATLSNGTRPDCIVHMPNDTPPLVIDAKFPLEAWNAIRSAESGEEKKSAVQSFRRDVEVHIRAISEKYLLNGETQDTAFMFVPSESIFAEIHENFEALVQRAHRSRIIIVSPSLLMLSIQVIQSVLKDARMREQAHLIQGEVIRLMEDVGRLDERVRKLQAHFGQATRDIDMILTSTDKLTKRGRRIEELEFSAPSSSGKENDGNTSRPETVESKSGNLRLRVVEGED